MRLKSSLPRYCFWAQGGNDFAHWRKSWVGCRVTDVYFRMAGSCGGCERHSRTGWGREKEEGSHTLVDSYRALAERLLCCAFSQLSLT